MEDLTHRNDPFKNFPPQNIATKQNLSSYGTKLSRGKIEDTKKGDKKGLQWKSHLILKHSII